MRCNEVLEAFARIAPFGDPHPSGLAEEGWTEFSRMSQNTLDTFVGVTELKGCF